ncbi:hypothetical protein RJ641_002354 [Dillenia turbinata]|uniref:Uncharacterized protein n=1 Tax=Dillenia turbinata TaxID=194707 RepID=A0AAN8ZFJ9_9MAGN
MACSRTLLLVLFILSVSLVSSAEARKLLSNEEYKSKTKYATLDKNLVLNALPKGTVPPSAPSKKGQSTINNEKLFARHLAAVDRILRSVPSPGTEEDFRRFYVNGDSEANCQDNVYGEEKVDGENQKGHFLRKLWLPNDLPLHVHGQNTVRYDIVPKQSR